MSNTIAESGLHDRGPGLFAETFMRPDGREHDHITNVRRIAGTPRDRAGTWLKVAMAALAVLAGIAGVVSYEAQLRMIETFRHAKLVSELQAAIPDLAALVFAALGIALALHGKRALRSRLLNLASIGASIYMNALAATGGWKALSVWVLAPVAYALTSDTLIGVIRTYTVAKMRAESGDESTPMAMLGRAALWLVRLAIAPRSTAGGLRRMLLAATPVPESPTKAVQATARPAIAPTASSSTTTSSTPTTRTRRAASTRKPGKGRSGSKTSAFLATVADIHGPLDSIALDQVYKISSECAAKVDLDAGSARTALRKAVMAAQAGDAR